MAIPAFWRIDEFVKAANGYAMANGQVFFCTQPANTVAFPPSPLVQLYADPFGLTPISQPLVCDGFGHVDAYVAAGTYTMVVALSNVIQNVYADQSYGLSSAQVLFETNGVPNPNQGVLNIVGAGDVNVFTNVLGQTVIESTGFVLPGTGTGNLVVTAFSGVTTAPNGDILTVDGLGNAQDSGVQVGAIAAETARAEAAEALLAPKANPTFTGTITGSAQTLSGTATFNGDVKIVTQVEFPYDATVVLGGSGDNYGGLIQNVINAMASASLQGGVIDAQAKGVSLVAQGSIDPGNLAIKILLGPWNYTFTNIKMRSGLQVIGAGQYGASQTGTLLQASSTASGSLFTGPMSSADGVVLGVHIENMTIVGPGGDTSTPTVYNSLDCFYSNVGAAAAACGMQECTWRNLNIGGFGMTNFHFVGGTANEPPLHQYLGFYDIVTFTNQGYTSALTLTGANAAVSGVTTYLGTITGGAANALIGITFTVTGFDAGYTANNGTFICVGSTSSTLLLANAAGVARTHAATATGINAGSAVQLIGAVYQTGFYNCMFNSSTGNGSLDTSCGTVPLILLAGSGTATNGPPAPYGISFTQGEVNGREVAVQLDGAQNVLFANQHMEWNNTCYLITYGVYGSNLPTVGISITDNSFNGDTAINSGSGAVLDIATVHCNGIFFTRNCYNGTGGSAPDAWLVGGIGAPFVQMFGNSNSTTWSSPSAQSLLLGGGQPATIVGVVHTSTTQAASIGAQAWFTPAVSGLYRFSGSITCTKTGTGSETCEWGIYAYENQGGSSSQNPIGTPTPVGASNGAVGYENSGSMTLYCVAANSVSYYTTLSATTGTPNYALNIVAEYLG